MMEETLKTNSNSNPQIAQTLYTILWCNSLWLIPHLLGVVIAVDVVAVGVAARALHVDSVTLQDCGFLEKRPCHDTSEAT